MGSAVERREIGIQQLEINTSSFKMLHASYIFEFKNECLLEETVDCNELSNSFEFCGASWILGIMATPTENTDDLSLRIYIVKRRLKGPLLRVRWRLSLLDDNNEKKESKEGEITTETYYAVRFPTEKKRKLQDMGLMTDNSILISLELTVKDSFPDRACLEDNQDRRNGWMNLSNDLLALFENKEDADFMLHVCGEKFPVHKLILSARSPVFKAMFAHEMREKKENFAVMGEMEPSDMKYFLTYIYTGTIPDMPFESLCNLFVIADMYAVFELKRLCLQIMIPLITKYNVWYALHIAEKCDKMLMDASVDFIIRHPHIMLGKNWKYFNENYAKVSIDILNEFITRTVPPIFIPIED